MKIVFNLLIVVLLTIASAAQALDPVYRTIDDAVEAALDLELPVSTLRIHTDFGDPSQTEAFPLYNGDFRLYHVFRAVVVDEGTDNQINQIGFQSGWDRMGDQVAPDKGRTQFAPDANIIDRIKEYVGVIDKYGRPHPHKYPANANVVGTSMEPKMILSTAVKTAKASSLDPNKYIALWELKIDPDRYQLVDVHSYYAEHHLKSKFWTDGEVDVGSSIGADAIVKEYRVCIDASHCPLAVQP